MTANFLIAVAFWSIVSACVCGFLAPTKGRESGPWFIAGLFFGWIAIAVLAFMEKAAPAPGRATVHTAWQGPGLPPWERASEEEPSRWSGPSQPASAVRQSPVVRPLPDEED